MRHLIWVLFAVVPLAMAFSTLVLPDRPNRWANGLVGGTLAVFWALEIVGPTAGATLLVATVVVMGLLIAWHAWAWPRATSDSEGAGADADTQSQASTTRS